MGRTRQEEIGFFPSGGPLCFHMYQGPALFLTQIPEQQGRRKAKASRQTSALAPLE
jgi:hypothetical protein